MLPSSGRRKYGIIVSQHGEGLLSSSPYQIVEGRYLGDILDQPRAVSATLEKLEVPAGLADLRQALKTRTFKRIVLTGMGASLYALYPLYLRLMGRGFPAVLVETAELVHSLQPLIAEGSVIVAVSQSGESAETVRLLEMNAGAPIVGITNTPESSLALRSSIPVLTNAGAEFSVSCKTYVTAHMALHLIGTFLCGEDVEAARDEMKLIAPAMSEYLTGWREHVLTMADELRGVQQIFVLGRGTSLGSAAVGALYLKESVRFRSEGMSSAAFRHGPFETLTPETFALIFGGAKSTRPLELRLLQDIRSSGGRCQLVVEGEAPQAWSFPKILEGFRPIVEILPVQMMTLALAAQRGMEAGRFTRISKVTSAE
jgi:glucosamine--fructose-6-phosphate aminotransferase (isomerizing)